jgi:hypothetical protein
MRTRPDRWEQGSGHHLPVLSPPARAAPAPWRSGRLVFSGRDALRLLLDHGARRRGWRRLWVPDFFCQEVVAAMRHPRLELRAYPDDPRCPAPAWPDARRGDAVLVANTFGLRGPVAPPGRDGVEVVEDHSHDPESGWARRSAADFCVASLRKTLPLPCGGALWSPRGHGLPAPAPLSGPRRAAAATVLCAMALKALYLGGHPVEKERFRALALEGERGIGLPGAEAIDEVAQALLARFPRARWRRARARNHAALRRHLEGLGWARVLLPARRGAVPFSCVLELDSPARRERLRGALVAGRVYPAVLWPLEQPVLPVGGESLSLSRRLLSLHCDARYGSPDLARVAALVARGATG